MINYIIIQEIQYHHQNIYIRNKNKDNDKKGIIQKYIHINK